MLLRMCGRLFVIEPVRALVRNKVRSGLADGALLVVNDPFPAAKK